MIFEEFSQSRTRRTLTAGGRTLRALGLDGPLTGVLALIVCFGILVVYSASGQNWKMVEHHLGNIAIAVTAMIVLAKFATPQYLRLFAPIAYVIGVLLLIVVEATGHIGKGAQRWLDVGFVRFQPSEIMKLALPMMLAWYFHKNETALRVRAFAVAGLLLVVPVLLIARQPDLGTAVLVAAVGFYVIFFAGIGWKVLVGLGVLGLGSLFPLWGMLHDYQRRRILTLIDPTQDPLGAGYHTIQSTIAVGSGGLTGKGWLNGTQTHLEFIPERHTDFIFAVFSEEFGLIGNALLITLYALLIARGLMIAANAPTFFARLLAASVTLMFFTYAFVNMGMVSGILPVVGVPLPFISYGGTALLTLFIGIGILMSVHSHRRLVQT
jgi:rod shape determining protein RodA